MDSEWFTVEHENGRSAGKGSWPNRETADKVAADTAQGTDLPVEVVRYVRTVVARVTRSVTVTAEDLATGEVATMSTTSPDMS